MELSFDSLTSLEAYQWMTMAVVPRPIAWITSRDPEGSVNVAPFSFFTCLSAHPPLIGVTIMSRHGEAKDTLQNAQSTGDFVVNVVTEDTLEAANLTSIEAPHEFSEAEYAQLELMPSARVQAPRIRISPIQLECTWNRTIPFGMDDGESHPSHLLVGKIEHIHVDDAVLQKGYVDPMRLKAVGRLGGPLYSGTTQVFRHDRPRYPDDAITDETVRRLK